MINSEDYGTFCPHCGIYFKYPGFYQHVPKCAEEHDFQINYGGNNIEESEEKIDKPSVIKLVKMLINRNEHKIENKMKIIEDKIEYMENKEIFEKKLEINKMSFIDNMNHGIYFIKCNDYVKIGYSQRISKRLYTLRCANPYPLDVLLCIKGSMRMESYLHDKFRKYRIKGEWFTLSLEIKSFIKEINSHNVELNL